MCDLKTSACKMASQSFILVSYKGILYKILGLVTQSHLNQLTVITEKDLKLRWQLDSIVNFRALIASSYLTKRHLSLKKSNDNLHVE